uniref:JmjC domain-containing protein n=1 Tax=Grammatophora oceanica TaxID=210454 RepID=A0A6U5H2S0_9STRA
MGYDIHDCPPQPPEGYPYAFPILDVLNNWPPDDPIPRPDIHQSLCVFDYRRDRSKAWLYRQMEKPFVVKGDPAVAQAVERWNHEDYMKKLMNTVPHRTEYSENNHFMYWIKPARSSSVAQKLRRASNRKFKQPIIEAPNNWTEPTKMMRMTYEEWIGHANVTDDKLGPDNPHWYYRLIGCGDPPNCDVGSSEYLFDELTFFQPKENQLYLTEHRQQKGIHCRFGMKGVIAENHFDGSRNFVVVLGGERRYIVSEPNQCEMLALHPKEHPSARHSAIDWSDPDLESFPKFKEAKTSEVVLQAGDVLYLPTNWFHYIISLTLNYQCNTRSGVSTETMQDIRKCGF